MRILLGVLALTAVIAGCSKAPSAAALSPPPGVPLEDNFGTGFGQDFRAAPNSAPANPSPGDAIPVDPNGRPLQIP